MVLRWQLLPYEGVPKAGYAKVLDTRVVEVQALPVQTINRQAELITLTRACRLAKGQSLKLCIDYQPASSLRRMSPHTPAKN